MEWAVIWFLSIVAVGEQNKATNERVQDLELQILQLEKQDMKIIGGVAANKATQSHNHDKQQNHIDNLLGRVELLEWKETSVSN